MNVFLYHGTMASNLDSILKHGLRPRGKRPSHDSYLGEGEMASYPEFVYLTDSLTSAAGHIVRISERLYDGAPVALIQVDATGLDLNLAYPDEDWIAEEWNSDLPDFSHRMQMSYMKRHKDCWQESLTALGTIAYRGFVRPNLLSIAEVDSLIADRRVMHKAMVLEATQWGINNRKFLKR